MPALLHVAGDSHYSLSRAAKVLGMTRQRVLTFGTAGSLTATVMGGRLFFERSQVEALRDRLATERKAARRGRR